MSFTFTRDDVRQLSDDQKDAIMESLLVAVLADGVTPRTETNQFDAEVDAITWGLTPAELVARMKAAKARVAAAYSRDHIIDLVEWAGERLAATAIREKVFRAMGSIMFADDRVPWDEALVLATYADAFDISRDRFDAIRAAITAL